jgi:hypothetical protein
MFNLLSPLPLFVFLHDHDLHNFSSERNRQRGKSLPAVVTESVPNLSVDEMMKKNNNCKNEKELNLESGCGILDNIEETVQLTNNEKNNDRNGNGNDLAEKMTFEVMLRHGVTTSQAVTTSRFEKYFYFLKINHFYVC